MDAAELEKLLRRTNPTISKERAALANGRWEDHLRERVPPPSRFFLIRRRAWQMAYERALQLGCASEVRNAVVFPVWYCSNQDDGPTEEWRPTIVVAYEDDSYELYEDASPGNVIVVARLEEARLGFIVPSRFYAPEITLPYRNEHYVAVESRRIERVVGIDQVVSAPPVAEPARAVPAFSSDAEPAVTLDAVEPPLAARVRHATDKLRNVQTADGASHPGVRSPSPPPSLERATSGGGRRG